MNARPTRVLPSRRSALAARRHGHMRGPARWRRTGRLGWRRHRAVIALLVGLSAPPTSAEHHRQMRVTKSGGQAPCYLLRPLLIQWCASSIAAARNVLVKFHSTSKKRSDWVYFEEDI